MSAGGGPDISQSTSVGERSRAGAGANRQGASPFVGKRITLAATGLGLFMIFLDAMVVNVALPDIQDDFGGGEADLQWIVAAYTLAMAVSIMTAAAVADHYGRRRIYVIALVIFTLASAACGLAPGTPFLVVARALQGAAAAAVNVASLALVSAAFPDAKVKARAIGLWTAVATLGLAMGPTVGGFLTQEVGWRSVFLVNVPIGILAVVLTVIGVGESRDPRPRSLDWPGQALFIVGFGALCYALIEAPQDGWTSPTILGLFAVAVVALAGLVLYELRARQPMMDVRLFARSTYTTAIVIVFFALAGGYGMLLVVTQYFQNVQGYSPLVAGLLMLGFSLPSPFTSVLEGSVVGRVGPRAPSLVGVASVGVGLAVIAGMLGVSIVGLEVGLVLMGVGLGLCIPATTGIAMASVPDDRAGMASGMLSAQRGLGSTVGFAVMGSIVALWLGSHLGPALEQTIPNPAERDRVVTAVSESANPRMHPGIAPASPLADEVADAADDVFADGSRIALAVGAVGAAGAFVLGWRYLPRREPDPEVGDP
ncbi:MAG: MFS transporter [Acidimicrobiia bacterium]